MRISDWSSDVCSSDLDRDLVGIALADDHIAAGRAAVVDQAVPGLLSGRKADVVARGHGVASGADANGEAALEDIEVLLLEDVPVRGRTLHAGRQLLDRHADTVGLAQRGEAQVPVAHGEARHVGPDLPGDVGGREGRWWLRRRLRLRSEEHTSELQSLMRISYAVLCF